jgi:hypothetical protein
MSADALRAEQPRDFDPVSFTVVPPRRFEDLHVGDIFRAPSRTLTDAHAPPPFKRCRLTIILSTTMWNMHDGTDVQLP